MNNHYRVTINNPEYNTRNSEMVSDKDGVSVMS
jgi:hypothetical protein